MPDQDQNEGGGPKPGHFLPGGAGEGAPEPEHRKPQQVPSLSKARDIAPPSYAGQPAQQHTGPAWRAAPHQQQVPPEPPRRRGAVVAGLVAAALVVVAGIVFASSKIIDSFEGLAGEPISGASTQPVTSGPYDPGPSPTVTKNAPPPPTDTQVVRQNKLYAAGRLTATCKEPGARPSSRSGVGTYAQALLDCLDKAWAPAVRKAGYEFRAPKLVLHAKGEKTCLDDASDDWSVYCGGEETVSFPWDHYVDRYRRSESAARIQLLDAVATVYAFHLQELTGILGAAAELEDEAASTAARNEVSRRSQLQAECLGAVSAGAIRASFPLRGRLLDEWTSGMDNARPDDPHTYGTRRANSVWKRQGFAAAAPGACNTWVAPAKKVN